MEGFKDGKQNVTTLATLLLDPGGRTETLTGISRPLGDTHGAGMETQRGGSWGPACTVGSGQNPNPV